METSRMSITFEELQEMVNDFNTAKDAFDSLTKRLQAIQNDLNGLSNSLYGTTEKAAIQSQIDSLQYQISNPGIVFRMTEDKHLEYAIYDVTAVVEPED